MGDHQRIPTVVCEILFFAFLVEVLVFEEFPGRATGNNQADFLAGCGGFRNDFDEILKPLERMTFIHMACCSIISGSHRRGGDGHCACEQIDRQNPSRRLRYLALSTLVFSCFSFLPKVTMIYLSLIATVTGAVMRVV